MKKLITTKYIIKMKIDLCDKNGLKLQNKLSLSKTIFPITFNESSFYKKALIKKNKIKEFILQKSS